MANDDLIPEFFKDFLMSLGIFDIGGWEIPKMGLIILGVSIILFFVISKLFSRIISKKLKLMGIPPNTYNGLKFFLRIIFAILLAILFTYLLNIQTKYIIIISGVIATAISFASMKAINNFIAGIWISLTSPFSVGNYININGNEGIITEISLNYTKVMYQDENITMIPNVTCLKSKIVNYTISTSWFYDEIKRLEKTIFALKDKDKNLNNAKKRTNLKHLEKKLKRLNNNYSEIKKIQEIIQDKGFQIDKKRSKYASPGKFVRYTFNLSLIKEPKKVSKILDKICEKWTDEFEIKPKYRILGIGSHLVYNFVVITPDPMDMIWHIGDFYKDIYKSVYKKE